MPAGVIVVAPNDAAEAAPGFYAVPEAYEEWEARLIPDEDLKRRNQPRGYDGFSLVLQRSDIGTALRRLEG